MHPILHQVTQRIAQRSQASRQAYLRRVSAMEQRPPEATRLSCGNIAHAVAGLDREDQLRIVEEHRPNLAVVSAYNEMLSAHQPYVAFPTWIREEAHRLGATSQFAGGVPAMCDGVTQGRPGMELSLFSRDVIAQATAVALCHDAFDAALLLGICDKIVPGLLIGALHFGHLPCVFVPAGPMSSGLPNKEKARVREAYAQGLVDRRALQAAESASYHSPGTCTFYGTANSNQMLLEAMGLHVPGAAFVHPHAPMREALTRLAVQRAHELVQARLTDPAHGSIGRHVDERCIVNAMVALLATGGSTNHLIHWVAVARSAGLVIDWDDFSQLSDVVPLLARIYPNGSADVNDFERAGGPGYVIAQLLDAGLMHEEVMTISGSGLRRQTQRPHWSGQRVDWTASGPSADLEVLRPADEPFSAMGGIRLLGGNLGRAVIKVSAVPRDRWTIEAPARVFDSQDALIEAFDAGQLTSDMVAVVRFQGPAACGMPELHKLTPTLGVLQERGLRVALVTDGRMSGASGKVPAAIHVWPEALHGGPLSLVRDGDRVRVDAVAGALQLLVSVEALRMRSPAAMSDELGEAQHHTLGRELFAGFRARVTCAEQGACTW